MYCLLSAPRFSVNKMHGSLIQPITTCNLPEGRRSGTHMSELTVLFTGRFFPQNEKKIGEISPRPNLAAKNLRISLGSGDHSFPTSRQRPNLPTYLPALLRAGAGIKKEKWIWRSALMFSGLRFALGGGGGMLTNAEEIGFLIGDGGPKLSDVAYSDAGSLHTHTRGGNALLISELVHLSLFHASSLDPGVSAKLDAALNSGQCKAGKKKKVPGRHPR